MGVMERITETLNPAADSSAILEVTEWSGDRSSQKSSYQAFFRGQNLMLLRKTAPERERGRTILLQRNRMWIELPAARRPLQLALEQRWTSDAAFADLARANFSRDYRVERMVEETAPGLTQHFSLQAVRADVPYSSVELWIDKDTGNPRRARFTTASKALSKNCEYGSYQNVVGRMRPVQFNISDPARPGWKAELVFRNWAASRLDSRFFDESALGKEESVVVRPQKPQGAVRAQPPLNDMVLVPAGPFVMGRDNGFPDEQPAHEVFLKAFWIDRTEVTVGQYRKFLKASGKKLPASPVSPSMPKNYFADAAYARFPMVDVSWHDAAAFCRWSDKRLPAEAEWEKAARGTDQRLYPWGGIWDENLANSRESTVSSSPERMVHFTTAVGSLPANASPYGALDMSGNVWEWVADWYAGYPGSRNQDDSYGQKYKVIRGGSWVSSSLSLATVARDFSDPRVGYDSIGFRCARDKNE